MTGVVAEAAGAYVAAYAATLSVALGAMAMIMVAHLTNANWFAAFRPTAERVCAALPALAVIGLALLLCCPVIYRWSTPLFALRWLAYWGSWLLINRLVRHGRGNMTAVSSAGLVVLWLTMTFAAFDWLMALSTGWSSTIYGVYWIAGGLTGALALLALITPNANGAARQSLGKLLLTFLLFWVYAGYSQYIVIWSADVPREVTWYVFRLGGAWRGVALALLIGGVVLPFLGLLFRGARRSGVMLAAAALVLLVAHYLDSYWMVLPGLVPVTAWMVLLIPLAIAVVVVPALVVVRSR